MTFYRKFDLICLFYVNLEKVNMDMNFIIYGADFKLTEKYKKIILKLIGPTKLNYEIIEYDCLKDNLEIDIEGNKIYIIDLENLGKKGIELAKKIRDSGDWRSPIIVITNNTELTNIDSAGKILMLDFIFKSNNIEKNLYDALMVGIEISTQNKTFCFLSHGEIFQIPYRDILYVEKNLNDNFSMIVTPNKVYQIRQTIHKLENILSEHSSIIKTHRSFLVNVKNIKHIDFEKGIISFGNHKTALVSRSNKKEIKKKMGLMEEKDKNVKSKNH